MGAFYFGDAIGDQQARLPPCFPTLLDGEQSVR